PAPAPPPPAPVKDRLVIDASASADGSVKDEQYSNSFHYQPAVPRAPQLAQYTLPLGSNPYYAFATQRHAQFSISTQDMKRRVAAALQKQAAE
ncbi:hypothetical protein PFISCL1PPCAC_7145, partial [Pristionchus fissidentatus]